ncbi:MAG: hypothetical protein ACLQU5_13500 [Isosphaeraceae bacterium]
MRVRPPRVCVLISREAAEKDLLLAFEYFSRIWGGRFGQLLVVDPKSPDELTRFRLGESRPEFVYGIDLDDDCWSTAVSQACQPRGYARLRREFVENLRSTHSEEYFLVDHALIHFFQVRAQRQSSNPILRIVRTQESTPFLAYCAATFGIHRENLRPDYFDVDQEFTGSTTTAFIELATEFVRDRVQSWLDVTGLELSPLNWRTEPLSPTVVLVDSLVPDMALFWNLRSASGTDRPAWIIPIPLNGATDPSVLNGLKEWLLAFLPYGPRPNYCLVTSQSVEESNCRQFAEQFQVALVGTPIESVAYEPSRNRLPVIIPFEYETTWAVDITGRRLTMQPPKPRAFEKLGSPGAWLVDLLKDFKTGRAVKELDPPPSPVVFELLNGPCPPQIYGSVIPRAGHGPESINLRCSGSEEVIDLYLPSADEILEEILREHGLEPIPDEKRSCYLPVIRKFGNVYAAAKAFRSESGLILSSLEDRPKTFRQINSECQLGRGVLPGKSYLEEIECLPVPLSERIRRITRRRFAKYAKSQASEDLKLASVLEFWANRRVLSRKWKIGPCARCMQTFYEPRLKIQGRILCPGCGNIIRLSEQVPLGYSLHRTVRHALKEGIVPVVLTGCFLRNMAHSGFLWLPGVKYKIGDKVGDIDILACCDGHLVFCECKRLPPAGPEAKVWNEVVSQFLETARVASLCGGDLAVLASQVSGYPQDVQDRIRDGVGTNIPYLLLDRHDLERGFRDADPREPARFLGIHDLILEPFPEEVQRAPERTQTINMGFAIYTHGIAASADPRETLGGGETQ